MAFSNAAFRNAAFSKAAFSIKTFSLTIRNGTLSLTYLPHVVMLSVIHAEHRKWRQDTQHNDSQFNDTQHNGIYVKLSINDTQSNNTLPLCLESHLIYCYVENIYRM